MSLKVEKISHKYGDNWILRDFSLELEKGEIFGILGATSAGKSTLLRLLAGLEKPSFGKIEFGGSASLFSLYQSGSKWKSFFSKGEDFQSDSEKIKNQLDFHLSKKPDLLLLDSPFSNLTESSRDEILHNLREIVKKEQIIVIFATNSYQEAFAFCDQVGVLYNGELAQSGTPKELYENPNCIAVARLLGRNNLIEAVRVTFNNQPIPEFQTTVGNHRLQTGKNDKSALGDFLKPLTLAIRPEHISISFGASFPEDNLLKAQILEVKYQGATTLIKLTAGGLILESLVLRLVGLKVGDECLVGLPPDRILVLKD